jgi:hypothetical protein
MAGNDTDLWSWNSFIKCLDSVCRFGGTIGRVVIWEKRYTKFGEWIGGRRFWDRWEKEEVNSRSVTDSLFWGRGLETLHKRASPVGWGGADWDGSVIT